MTDKLKLVLFTALLIAAIAFLYRVLTDAEVSTTAVAGLVAVLALAILTLLSDRLTEFSASSEGISAKLSKLDKNVDEIKTFLFGAIDNESLETLKLLATGQLLSPEKPEERDELKFRLRTLRQTGFILRDETQSESISDAVQKGGNVARRFKLTRMANHLLKEASTDLSRGSQPH